MTSPGAGSKDATAYLVKIIAVRTAIRMACWILETKKGEKRLRGEDQCFPTIRIEERTKSTARNKILKIRIPVMIRLILTGLVGSAGFALFPEPPARKSLKRTRHDWRIHYLAGDHHADGQVSFQITASVPTARLHLAAGHV